MDLELWDILYIVCIFDACDIIKNSYIYRGFSNPEISAEFNMRYQRGEENVFQARTDARDPVRKHYVKFE